MKKKILLASIFAIIIAVIGIVLLSQNENYVQNTDDSKPTLKADVIMPTKVSRPGCEKTDSCYIPSKISIKSGDSVTWLNEDAAFHSVTSGYYGNQSGLFDSEYLDPEEYFTFIFENPGIYDYFCTLHPWMKGQVIAN
ncbi:plastocyanin/azurin family copper-binding protein [Nitrosarchaeum sp.]|uniref:cupredoxin domain-containing protein n=1 Tax=Nitrosarchaeum sp. TaxID=2026886 RepID=UPI00247C33F6|nr:plastocyanin/azurin family copper-binding protein [Nitrosarchaeum sp.]MCV0413141.1 cupredoxin domain-containing protein [Nitrosarchaeum sp.]